MTAVAAFVERIKRERAERGQPSTIQSPGVYRLLDAVLARQSENDIVTKS
jgi:hypothetical protein